LFTISALKHQFGFLKNTPTIASMDQRIGEGRIAHVSIPFALDLEQDHDTYARFQTLKF